jgi:ribosomal protein S18 acetylase RimI-like enzyme
MVITYKVNTKIEPHQLSELFQSSGIRRPSEDLSRLKKMLDNANMIVSAWDGEKLVGIARALSDFSFCCYLSDLAVAKEYQNQGIGQELVTEVQKQIGDESNLVMMASQEVIEYAHKIGFEPAPNAFIVHRKK